MPGQNLLHAGPCVRHLLMMPALSYIICARAINRILVDFVQMHLGAWPLPCLESSPAASASALLARQAAVLAEQVDVMTCPDKSCGKFNAGLPRWYHPYLALPEGRRCG